MAEKAENKHALCVALTYSDETQEGRDGARFFCYADVRAFVKRLKSALRRAKLSDTVRFICAGEQGDRNGRCHWHMVLFSDVDLTQAGSISGKFGPITDRASLISVGKHMRRLNWSLWPFGFVTFQEPDQGGMSYVLSYCLKDQFTVENSQGTMREAKAENFATGLFRMSKRPAIGERWLIRKMEALDATGSVLPSLNIKIPDFAGYWQPSGSFRKKLLWHLVALNKRSLWTYGRNAPQWSALLSSCSDNESDMEILNGTFIEEKIDPKHKITKLGRQLESYSNFRDKRRAEQASGPCICYQCCKLEDPHTLISGGRITRIEYEGDEVEYYWYHKDHGVEYSVRHESCKYLPDGPF
ncbi:rolling circle replication-associated protein [Pseudogemmobacter faecipullorum]|uniref:Replication-associated protein ORF2/G2P domain-containing protein n=1 Tax=Pseudogemmobacter faecipullorum TaxID=2755041 RepID=A0ABS8CLN5_9RHOB|nr:hypothetical protein [Pseudogemmobacter faecipullorum]MCB5410307.1 hypothetical protein [Pseudogemmobacter faecipullorum]